MAKEKMLRNILNRSDVTSVKITDFATVRVKFNDGLKKRVLSEIFSSNEDYLDFVSELLDGRDYVQSFPVTKFVDDYSAKIRTGVVVNWLDGEHPTVLFKKLV